MTRRNQPEKVDRSSVFQGKGNCMWDVTGDIYNVAEECTDVAVGRSVSYRPGNGCHLLTGIFGHCTFVP